MLRVEIIGNLGSDPEQRFTSSGAAQTTFRAAVNSRRRGADGEYVERTDWFRVRTMGPKAEYVQRFTKGQRVLVIGRLEIGEWTTREGERRTSYDIWADDVVNVSARDDAPRDDGSSAPVTAGTGAGRRRPAGESEGSDLEDLPF